MSILFCPAWSHWSPGLQCISPALHGEFRFSTNLSYFFLFCTYRYFHFFPFSLSDFAPEYTQLPAYISVCCSSVQSVWNPGIGPHISPSVTESCGITCSLLDEFILLQVHWPGWGRSTPLSGLTWLVSLYHLSAVYSPRNGCSNLVKCWSDRLTHLWKSTHHN